MKQVTKLVQLLTVVLNSAFIGGMVLIAIVIVPFWQSSQSQQFLDWFSTYSGSIGSIMIPLGPGVLVLAITGFFLSKTNKKLWGLTIAFTLVNIMYFPIYFLPTNNSFAEQTIEVTKVSAELSTWLNFHWQRMFFAFAALITSILAIIKNNAGQSIPAAS